MTAVREPKPSIPPPSAGELFAALLTFYAATNPHVGRVRLFGFDCLRIAGKVFAKMHNGNLVVKLPTGRIATLVDSGHLRPYHRSHGRRMKEWAVVAATNEREILALAEESRVFTVGGTAEVT